MTWIRGTRGLREADQAVLLEHLAHAPGDGADLVEVDLGHRVEVDPQLVGMVEVAAPNRPGVPVDHAEVDSPSEVRGVGGDELACVRPLGNGTVAVSASPARCRARVLEEEIAVDAVDPALERRRTVAQVPYGRLLALEVVVDEVELRDPRAGKKTFPGFEIRTSRPAASIVIASARGRHRLGESHDGPACPAGARRPRLLQGHDSAPSVAEAIGRGLRATDWTSTSRRSPTAARAPRTCSSPARRRAMRVRASDPLGREIEASFALLGDGARR